MAAKDSASNNSKQRYSPFLEIPRQSWAKLAEELPISLSENELVQLRGLGDKLDLAEVTEVYLPLSKLISLHAIGTQKLHDVTDEFLKKQSPKIPYIIGIAGSVAVGKSTTARVLRELLARWPETPRVELVTTDGFLYPNAKLEDLGLLSRKGFPESYNQKALLRFVTAIKSGAKEVKSPYYSHLSYDIVPDAEIVIRQPDILIIEGLNVLQPPRGQSLALSDLFDFSIYVDAKEENIAEWYINRFLKLQRGAFSNPNSYFHKFATLSESEAIATAKELWQNINYPNLVQNIQPTRARAKLVLRKETNHKVNSVLLRKL